MLNIEICIAENVMLMVMIVMMMMTALMMELMLKRFVPVQTEVFVNKMSSQGNVGVLGAGAPNISGCSHADIAEVHKKLDDFGEYVLCILAHLLPVGASSFDVEAFVEEADEAVKLRAVDEAEGEEVAADQLQQEAIKLLLKGTLRVNLCIPVDALLHGHLSGDQLGLPLHPVGDISILGLLISSHILPLGPVLSLQVPSKGLCAPTRQLVLHLVSC